MRVSPFSLAVGGAAPVDPCPRSARGGAVFFMVLWASPSLRPVDDQEKTAGLSPAVMFHELYVHFQILKPSSRGVDRV